MFEFFPAPWRAPRTLRRNLVAASVMVAALLTTLLTVASPLASATTDPIADITLGTATAYSSISSGALTVGAGADVAGSAVVGPGAASTTGAGAAVGAAVAGIEQAQADLAAAYAEAIARQPTALINGDISGTTFLTGVYHAGAAIANNGTITLDAQGNPDAVFIFQIEAAFASAAVTSVVLANGAQSRHVYWQVLGAVTIGANATFAGTILAWGAVTVGADTVVSGRTLSVSGAVSLGAGMGTLGVPEISLSNSPSPADLVFDGETITYTFVVTNSGNVALTVPQIMVTGIPGVSAVSYVWSATPGILLPKESVTGTATYLATFADAVKRSVTATAVVAGTSSTDVIVLASQAKKVIVWPIPVVDAVTANQGEATTFDVLTNDQTLPTGVGFSRAELTVHPRPIGDATALLPAAPLFGSVTCSATGSTRGLCTYQSAPLFTGTDGFDYSVSQLGRSWNVHVTVAVAQVVASPVVRDDRVVATTRGTAVAITPLANDAGSGVGTLVILSVDTVPATQGALSCSESTCTYVPPTSGFVGTVSTHYHVAEQAKNGSLGPSAAGAITIFVDAPALVVAGFSSQPRDVPTITSATWSANSLMHVPVSTCVAGRPNVTIAWEANATATSWMIERRSLPRYAGDPQSEWVAIVVLPGSADSFVDNRVGESRTLEYRVRPDLYRWQGDFSVTSSPTTTPNAVSAAGC